MKVHLIVVGRVRGVLRTAVEHYEERAGHYWRLEVVEVEAGAPGRAPEPERVREAEGERIRSRLPAHAPLWVLTREGKAWSSERWARELGAKALHGAPGPAILVGGAFGIADALVKEAERRVSLGPVTLPHEMARLVLAEQLYRAGTIQRNEPYHKGRGE